MCEIASSGLSQVATSLDEIEGAVTVDPHRYRMLENGMKIPRLMNVQ
jgi:hypothetical protein